jgi:hypothetical protein
VFKHDFYEVPFYLKTKVIITYYLITPKLLSNTPFIYSEKRSNPATLPPAIPATLRPWRLTRSACGNAPPSHEEQESLLSLLAPLLYGTPIARSRNWAGEGQPEPVKGYL